MRADGQRNQCICTCECGVLWDVALQHCNIYLIAKLAAIVGRSACVNVGKMSKHANVRLWCGRVNSVSTQYDAH